MNGLLPAEQGVYTLLGFARKAGCLLGGSDAVTQALNRRQVRLVLLAGDLSANSRAHFWQSLERLKPARRQAVQVWRFGSKQQLGQAVGRPPCGIWALADENFCRGLQNKLGQLQQLEPSRAALLTQDWPEE